MRRVLFFPDLADQCLQKEIIYQYMYMPENFSISRKSSVSHGRIRLLFCTKV